MCSKGDHIKLGVSLPYDLFAVSMGDRNDCDSRESVATCGKRVKRRFYIDKNLLSGHYSRLIILIYPI